jgi:SOS-response transcriptional repressor LexA
MVNMKFRNYLTYLRDKSGFTKTRLANELNRSLTVIINWENGKKPPPKIEMLNQICDILHLTAEERKTLIKFSLDERSPNETDWVINNFDASKTDEKVFSVPVISWVLANRFHEIQDPFPPGNSDEYVSTKTRGVSMFALKVKSDCMEPEFKEGDIIVINPEMESKSGDYVIVKNLDSNEATFKQLRKKSGKTFLHPLNEKYKDIELSPSKRYEIVGKVVEKIKKY